MIPPNGSRDKPDVPLTLVTLGGWELLASHDGSVTPLFGPSKPLALLVYLALSPGRAVQREHLLDLLWADLEPSAANHAYRQTIWYIRQRLGEGCLKTGGNQLTLASRLEADRDQFLAAVQSQHWERAVGLYTGDFLPGFAAPGGAEFERWADLERWRLRSLFVRAGDTLARRHLASGRAREAVTLARRVRDADRSGEAGWRLLLEALVAAGDPVGVSMEADQLEEMLREEGRDAEPATRAVLRLARQESRETIEAPAQRGLVAELVGREREFGAVVAAWEAARRGEPQHLHVIGAAGLGKSRLLADAQTRLRASGARTVLVRAAPGERSLSYALAADLAVALAAQRGSAGVSSATAGTLVGLAPALAANYPGADPDRSTGEEMARRRVLALADLLAAVADEGPCALLVDDVHWMDPQSRQLVVALLGRLGRSAVLVITTTRPGAEGSVAGADTVSLPLDPLTAPQVAALVTSFGSVPDESWARTLPDRLRGATKGTPLIVIETLELAIERGVLDLGADGWRCPVPADLDRLLAGGAALRQRLEHLSREQRWLLLLFAVHGAPLPPDAIRQAAPRSDEALQADLLTLEQRGLALRAHGEWQPGHDAIAELAIELAPVETVRAAHAALGHATETAGGDGATLPRTAQHYAAAGDLEGLKRAYARWVRRARLGGDPRDLTALARELLGSETNGNVAALVRTLPLRQRFRAFAPGGLVAAIGLVVLVAAAVAWALTGRGESVLRVVAFMPDGDGVRQSQVEIGESDWLDERTIDLRAGTRVPDLPSRVAPRPVGISYLGSGLWAAVVRDTGANGEEPRIYAPQGTKPYPPAPGDDAVGSASPDGRYLAVYTDRWSKHNAGDVGIFDLVTGSLRQLTSGPTRDIPGPWSPDGTRIAVYRERYDLKPNELCWVSFDGQRKSCFVPSGILGAGFAGGWTTARDVLIRGIDSTGTAWVYSADVDTHQLTRLFASARAVGAANGPWVLCRCAVGDGDRSEWEIRRADAPGRAIRLAGADEVLSLAIAPPSGRAPTAGYLDRLVVKEPPEGSVEPGVPFHLSAQGRTARGTDIEVPAPVIEWRVADTTIATVTDEGGLTGRRPGRTVVYASAGGWRRDSAAVVVAARSGSSDTKESWSADWLERWRPFGYPKPRLVRTAAGAALFIAGDSDYYSGVYSKRVFPTDSGLAIRAVVRTPSPTVKWQILHLSMPPLLDTAALRQWDHTTGGIPRNSSDAAASCDVNYPAGEAKWGRRFVALSAGEETFNIPVETALASGRPWVVLLQLLPDGECGIAINGRAVRLPKVRPAPGLPRHVLIDGQSVRTRILVDSLEVYRGVYPGPDWTQPDRPAAQRPGRRP